MFTTLLACVLSLSANAAPYEIIVNGTVDFNVLRDGDLASVTSGDDFRLRMMVDSERYTDSETWNTRGYRIDPSSFVVELGDVSVPLVTNRFMIRDLPQYFVVRESDPVADGFFLSRGTDWPFYPQIAVDGNLSTNLSAGFEVGFNGDELDTLNIEDAVGLHGYGNITSFYLNIVDGGIEVIYGIYESVEIVEVP